MKKWHMEGIVNSSDLYRRKIVVPDEDQMYHRIHAYLHKVPKESPVVSFLRDMVGRVLRHV